MRRFLRRNEMHAAYWKQTCFFFLALQEIKYFRKKMPQHPDLGHFVLKS